MPIKKLFYDIETSPIIGYTWGVWQQDVVKVLDEWQILSVAWKWQGEKTTHVVGQCDFPDYKPGVNNDKSIVEFIHGLFDTADIVIAHNGDQFDQKKVTARFLIHKMAPPMPYKSVDTKKVAKRVGMFTSNRLGSLADNLNIARKGDPGGIATWYGCLQGDDKAWRRMKRYNRQDIPPLEDLYDRLLPYMTNHPSLAVIGDRPDACPNCGQGPMHKRGFKHTKTGKKQQYQCQNCFAWCSDRKNIKMEIQYVS